MRDGFREGVGGPVRARQVDLAAARERRAWVHQQVRLRRHLLALISTAPTSDCMVAVEGEPPAEAVG